MKIPPCGAFCQNCGTYKKLCRGCIETSGKAFHLKMSGQKVCPIWECVENHRIKNCAVCEEFPCDIFLNVYHPERGISSSLARAGLLMLRKKIGTDAWIKWVREKKVPTPP